MGAMTVASATHRANGPLAANRGFELPLTNLAAAAVLAACRTGPVPAQPAAQRRLTRPCSWQVARYWRQAHSPRC